mmetsp:Transcript_26665/g.76325  ORF Transcript_26665/g.76325 Transcript_26665/m.76325 type:complete len:205 (+) Transcript_26665:700-1314(+)
MKSGPSLDPPFMWKLWRLPVLCKRRTGLRLVTGIDADAGMTSSPPAAEGARDEDRRRHTASSAVAPATLVWRSRARAAAKAFAVESGSTASSEGKDDTRPSSVGACGAPAAVRTRGGLALRTGDCGLSAGIVGPVVEESEFQFRAVLQCEPSSAEPSAAEKSSATAASFARNSRSTPTQSGTLPPPAPRSSSRSRAWRHSVEVC